MKCFTPISRLLMRTWVTLEILAVELKDGEKAIACDTSSMGIRWYLPQTLKITFLHNFILQIRWTAN